MDLAVSQATGRVCGACFQKPEVKRELAAQAKAQVRAQYDKMVRRPRAMKQKGR